MRTRLLLALTATLLSLTACSGEDTPNEEKPADDVMTTAQEKLDETSGVQLRLSTDDLPAGTTGIISADGVATHAPAFDGTIEIPFGGAAVPVDVRAVDGTVYAEMPGTVGWSEVNPADFQAPDPADLISPETGVSSLLTATEDLEKGDSVRGGADNDEILTTFTGTVPGADMKKLLPSADSDSFDVSYQVADSGELRKAVLTGVFYPDTEEMTYTVDLTDYGTDTEIKAP